jgi:molybdate transport system ATP-binding protein
MWSDELTLRCRVRVPGFELVLDETLAAAGVTAVFGPSGSGKSLLLRALAGLERPLEGRLALADTVWFDSAAGIRVPAHRRRVGYMFQDARLFAHLDVAGNLAYASRRARAPGPDAAEVVAALDLAPLLARRVTALSGGERQRVALARTLLGAPRLLLLDEPLAALDRDRKGEILPYLETVTRRFALPTLFVSHDVDEVARLADRVLVLATGRAVLRGTTVSVFEQLELSPLAPGFETGAVLEGRVQAHDVERQVTLVEVSGDLLTLPLAAAALPGSLLRLRVRARDVALAVGPAPTGLSIRNVLPGVLVALQEDGVGWVGASVRLRGGAVVRARITRAAVADLALAPGQDVYALIKTASFDGGP